VAGAVTLGGIATFSAQPIFSSLTASSAVATDASKGLVSVTNTGTGNNVLATSPTITTPVISSIVNTGTLTLPTSTDTLVGRATTDTLTNKTLTTPVISSLSSASATALTLQSAGTTAITVDTSQNVGVNTTSPSYKLDVQRTANNGTGVLDVLRLRSTGDNADDGPRLLMTCGNSTTGGAAIGAGGVAANSANLLFYAGGNTERMRIDTSGNLNVGRTVATTSNTVGCSIMPVGSIIVERDNDQLMSLNRLNGNGTVILFSRGAGNSVGNITLNTSSTTYNTSSDYRLKHDIAPMTGALAKIAQLKPVTYKWKVDGEEGQGFIAHELQEVVPDCVTGAKDAVDADGNPQYQGIDTSFLVATLTAALQETKALIDTQAETINALTARIVALENA
jgi:hypothetical protein